MYFSNIKLFLRKAFFKIYFQAKQSPESASVNASMYSKWL